MDTKKIEAAVAQIIEAVGEDGSREGLQETPQRIAKMYQEIFAGLGETAEEHLAKSFEIIEKERLSCVFDGEIALFQPSGRS